MYVDIHPPPRITHDAWKAAAPLVLGEGLVRCARIQVAGGALAAGLASYVAMSTSAPVSTGIGRHLCELQAFFRTVTTVWDERKHKGAGALHLHVTLSTTCQCVPSCSFARLVPSLSDIGHLFG